MKQDVVNMDEKLTDRIILAIRDSTGNILAALHRLFQVLQEKEGDKEQEMRYLAIIEQNLFRLMRTAIHLESAEKKDMIFRPGPVDGAGLCRDVGREVELLARVCREQGRNLHFTWSVDEESVLMVGDSQLLEMGLLYLISNAFQYAAQDGEVSLRAERRGEGWMVYTVKDNGAGFQPSPATEDDPYRGKQEGLGLGLMAARRIAEAHGGNLVLGGGGRGGVTAVFAIPIQPLSETRTGTLEIHTPRIEYTGGYSKALIELSTVLPPEVFRPEDLEE